LKAKWDAVKGLKRALQKRRQIQRQRRVDEEYVWSLLEKETFVPRLTRRFRTGCTGNDTESKRLREDAPIQTNV